MGALDIPIDPTALLKPLSVAHVLYDPSHRLSLPFALLHLSPIFLFSSYLTLLIINRPLSVLNLTIGQLLNEGLNNVLKEKLKGERPMGSVGEGWGMPSSHSQFVAYSSTFLTIHLLLLSSRTPSAPLPSHSTPWNTFLRRFFTLGLLAWAGLTAYSRVYLGYHTPSQVLAGSAIGALVGVVHAVTTEVVPFYWPGSWLGRGREWVAKRWEAWPVEGFGGFGPGGRGWPYQRIPKKSSKDGGKSE